MRMPWYALLKWHFAMDMFLSIVWLVLGATSIYRGLRYPESGKELDGILQIAFGVFWLHLALSHRRKLHAIEAELEAFRNELRQRQHEYASRDKSGDDQAS